jgi:hypothetical protein
VTTWVPVSFSGRIAPWSQLSFHSASSFPCYSAEISATRHGAIHTAISATRHGAIHTYTGLLRTTHKMQHLAWLSFSQSFELQIWIKCRSVRCLAPKQLVIRSAPKHSSRAVRCMYCATSIVRSVARCLSLSLSLSVLHCAAVPCNLIFCHSSVSFL